MRWFPNDFTPHGTSLALCRVSYVLVLFLFEFMAIMAFNVWGARKGGGPIAKIEQGYNLYLGWGSGLEGYYQESG